MGPVFIPLKINKVATYTLCCDHGHFRAFSCGFKMDSGSYYTVSVSEWGKTFRDVVEKCYNHWMLITPALRNAAVEETPIPDVIHSPGFEAYPWCDGGWGD